VYTITIRTNTMVTHNGCGFWMVSITTVLMLSEKSKRPPLPRIRELRTIETTDWLRKEKVMAISLYTVFFRDVIFSGVKIFIGC